MNANTKTHTRRVTGQATRSEILGLSAITDVLGDILQHRPNRATVARWLALGVRGHRITARRIGYRWATTRDALVAFARASGALPEGVAR